MATIEQRGNSYRITISAGYGLDGKQKRAKMTWTPDSGMTEKQIEKELNRQAVLFEEKCLSGHYISSTITLAEFSEIWFKDYAEKHLRPTALSRYKHLMKRILPALGHIRLDRLQPHHLLSFYSNLEESGIRADTKYLCKLDGDGYKALLKKHSYTKSSLATASGTCLTVSNSITQGKRISQQSADKICNALGVSVKSLFDPIDKDKPLSGQTIHYYHIILSSMFTTAVQWQIILSNPCDRVKAPKIIRKEAKYLDEVEATKLLQLLENENIQFRTMIQLLLFSGLRRSELLGLEWNDVHFDSGILHVRRSSLYLPGEGIFEDELKTTSSNRAIRLPSSIVLSLKSYKLWQAEYRLSLGDKWINSNRLFTNWCGAPLLPDNLSRWFHKFIQKNDLPNISIHSLRHTNATLQIAGGINPRTVASRLGHTEVSTTIDIYSHAIKSADEAAAEVLDDLLRPVKRS